MKHLHHQLQNTGNNVKEVRDIYQLEEELECCGSLSSRHCMAALSLSLSLTCVFGIQVCMCACILTCVGACVCMYTHEGGSQRLTVGI